MTMTENSPVCLSDLGSLQAQAPSVPTEGVTASGDESIGLRAVAGQLGWWVEFDRQTKAREGMAQADEHHLVAPPTWPSIGMLKRWKALLEGVADQIDTAQVGMEGEARNEQSPEPVKDQTEQGVEAVAWRWRLSAAKDWWLSVEPFGERQGEEEPLVRLSDYEALQKREAGLREALWQIADPASPFDATKEPLAYRISADLTRRMTIASQALGDQT